MKLGIGLRFLGVALLVVMVGLGLWGTAFADSPNGRGKSEERREEKAPGVKNENGNPHNGAIPGQDKRRGFVGQVLSVDIGGKKLAVETKAPRKTMVSREVTYNEETKCREAKVGEISCGDVVVGDRVAVNLRKGDNVARHIMVLPPKPANPGDDDLSEHKHAAGLVTALSDTSLTITLKNGSSQTFTEAAEVQIRPEGATVQQGSFVTLVLNGEGKVTAIKVHKEAPPKWPKA